MTANQINYAKHREEGRHNRTLEEIEREKLVTAQHQADTQRYQARTAKRVAQEQERANRAREEYNWWSFGQTLSEQNRHNVEQENVSRSGLAETIRHNTVSETLAQQDYQSMAALRSQQGEASLMQAQASQRSAEANYRSATAALQQATVAGIRAETEKSQLAELIRHNSINEAELNRHNVASEAISQYQAENADRSSRAAAMQAQTARGELNLSRSQAGAKKFGIISEGVKDITQSVKNVSGLAQSIISVIGGAS